MSTIPRIQPGPRWQRYCRAARDWHRLWKTTPDAHEAARRLAPARTASWWWSHFGVNPETPLPLGLPPISRSQLQEHPGAFIGAADLVALGYAGRTSGTTGEPVDVLMCAWAVAHYWAHLDWIRELANLPPMTTGRVLYLTQDTDGPTFREPHPIQPEVELVRVDAPPGQALQPLVQQIDPVVLCTTPTTLVRLVETCSDAGPSLDLVVTTAEHLVPTDARRAAAALGATTVNSYGLSEIGPVAVQCPHGAADFHVDPRATAVELVGDELAVTTLRNRAMPLARYLTGDCAEAMFAGKCPLCGHEGASFRGLSGRAAQLLTCRDGRQRTALPWIRLLTASEGLRRFQLCQLEPGKLDIVIASRVLPPGLDVELAEVDHTMDVTVRAISESEFAGDKSAVVVRT